MLGVYLTYAHTVVVKRLTPNAPSEQSELLLVFTVRNTIKGMEKIHRNMNLIYNTSTCNKSSNFIKN